MTLHRRTFLKTAGLLAAGASIAKPSLLASTGTKKNKLPKWRGFNLMDFYGVNDRPNRIKSTAEHFKWMQDWGFDFVRIPLSYPRYLSFDRTKNITPEEVYQIDERAIDEIDALVQLANKHNLHVSLNLHRAPGYCVNSGFHEPYNLWRDEEAVKAFCFHWQMWAKRYRHTSSSKVSFDLVNEPSMREDMNQQLSPRKAVDGDVYYRVAKAATDAIHAVSPDRLVIADGNNGGGEVTPELATLPLGQSCRGYTPGAISHYKASWANKDINNLPDPKWPGQVGDKYLSRDILDQHYRPWIKLKESGVGVHCGECGCYNKTPHAVALAWFGDVLDILTKNDIGYALWNFVGDFGILNSGRTDIEYEDWHGYKLDRKMLKLLQKYS